MKSMFMVNPDNGTTEPLVLLNDPGETYYLGQAIKKAGLNSWYSSAFDMLSNGRVHSVSIGRDHTYNVWHMISTYVSCETAKLPSYLRGNQEYVLGHTIMAAVNNLYSHSVDISARLCRWVKRKTRVPAMYYDGTGDGFDKAVRFTDLSPMFGAYGYDGSSFSIPTMEGAQVVKAGSYLVRGPEGEFYPVTEKSMTGLRVEVKDEHPFDSMPYVRFWENIPTPVDAITFDAIGTDYIRYTIDETLPDPHTLEFPRHGVMILTTETRKYVAHYSDVVVIQRTPGSPSVRFVRDDVFRNTYETSPEMIMDAGKW